MSFEQNVKTIGAQRHQTDPVAEARRQLAPTVKAAAQALQDFDAAVAAVRPTYDEAKLKWETADRLLGPAIASLSLTATLEQARQLMGKGGRAGIESVLATIDALTYYDVVQGLHRRLPGLLDMYKANIGALRDLAEKKLPSHLAELEEVIAERARTATHPPTPVLTTGDLPSLTPAPAPVEDLTPRPPLMG